MAALQNPVASRALERFIARMARPPRIPVWLPWDQPVIYFVTLCVQGRQPVLDNPAICSAVETFCRTCPNWQTIALILMPDHLHALIAPREREAFVTQYSAGLKRHVRRVTQAAWKWQDGVSDRLLRREESAESKWQYLRENPVRAGLVGRWEDWPYFIGDAGPKEL
jgi:REP element-mobilizing transposase RayT